MAVQHCQQAPGGGEKGREQRTLPPLAREHARKDKSCLALILNGEQVKINYTKLLQLCRPREGERSLSVDHAQFMEEYMQLFTPFPRPQSRWQKSRSAEHTPTGENGHQLRLSALGRKREKGAAGRGKELEGEKGALNSILKAISDIALTHPPLRSKAEVRRLANLLLHFPGLLPKSNAAVREGIAGRAFIESFRDRHGFALPGEGGVYLILDGVVQRIDRNSHTGKVTTTNLHMGQHFGLLQDPSLPLKHSYPLYWTKEKCLLLRITTADYHRAVESHKEAQFREKLDLVNSSPLLRTLPPAISHKLAKSITWQTFSAGTKLLKEGDQVPSISVVRNGRCSVYKSVPSLPRTTQVCIAELAEGCCVGELAVEGHEVAPYSVVATTVVHVGVIPVSELLAAEVSKNLSPARKYTVSLPSQEQLRALQASKLMTQQWHSLKRTVIKDVYRESGRESTHMHST